MAPDPGVGVGTEGGGIVENELGKRGAAATGVPEACMGEVVRRRSASVVLAGAGEGCTGGFALAARICARFSAFGAGEKEGGAACTGDGITGGTCGNDGV